MNFYKAMTSLIKVVKKDSNFFDLKIYYNDQFQNIDNFDKYGNPKIPNYGDGEEIYITVKYLNSEFTIRGSRDFPFSMPMTTATINGQFYNHEILFDLFAKMWSPVFCDLEKFIITIYAELVSMFK